MPLALILKTFISTIKCTRTTKMLLDNLFIKELAKHIGLDDCGISKAHVSSEEINKYTDWINADYHANMHYLKEHIEIRNNPQLLLDNAKSVISLIVNYNFNSHLNNQVYSIAKYAQTKDYHIVIKDMLKKMILELNKIDPKLKIRACVDTAPILERYFAKKSGLGYIGKNRCLITDKYGSYVFISELLIDKEFDYDKENNNYCNNCNLCVLACPTKAITEIGINTNKCIAYHTIESKTKIVDDIVLNNISNQIFGCDICQTVCPKNNNTNNLSNIFFPISEINNLSKAKLEKMTNADFKSHFKQSPLLRAGREKLLDNMKTLHISAGST